MDTKHFRCFGLLAAIVFGGFSIARSAHADAKGDVTEHVRSFYDNLSNRHASENVALFFRPTTQVVGISGGEGRSKSWQKPATEWLAEIQAAPARPYNIESLQVDILEGALATARVVYSAGTVRARAVLVFSSEGGTGKIVSYVFETRLQ